MSHQYDWDIPEIGWGSGIKHTFKIYSKKGRLLETDTKELRDLIENIAEKEDIYDYLNGYFDYGKFLRKGYKIKVYREGSTLPVYIIAGNPREYVEEWVDNFTVEKPRKRFKDLGIRDYMIYYLKSQNLKVGEEPPKTLMITLKDKNYYYELKEK